MTLAIPNAVGGKASKNRALWRKASQCTLITTTTKSSIPDPDSYLKSFHVHTTKYRFQTLINDAVLLDKKNADAEKERQNRKHVKRKHILMKFKIGMKKPPAIVQIAKSVTKNIQLPYVRFRRAARNVCKIIQVCLVCKKLVEDKVKREPWYNLIDNVMAESTIQKTRKGPRPFVTFVPNDQRELIQLTFDLSYFERSRKSESFLTDDVRSTLQQLPGTRSREQIASVIRCMKGISPEFNTYPLNIQKHMSQLAMYCKFAHNRVIVKRGFTPDGCYIVLSGTLVEKVDAWKQPQDIQSGDIFGEEDLICGCNRRTTVLTRTSTELFCIHKQDYSQIFNMAEDVNNPKNLDVCKQDVVFQHFPMHRLVENPGIWTIVRYKYGRLIAKDSNELDWVYVVKSGEARLLKYLEPSYVDIKTRRQKIAAAMERESPFFKKKQILQFIAERDYIKSSYRPSSYHPGRREGTMSAPPMHGNRKHGPQTTFLSLPCTPANKVLPCNMARRKSILKTIEQTDRDDTKPTDSARLPKIKIQDDEEDEDGKIGNERRSDEETKDSARTHDSSRTDPDTSLYLNQPHDTHKVRRKSECYVKTPTPRRKGRSGSSFSVYEQTLPAFVQVETLHTGQVFGLRACLDLEERGPSVSLVSGDCELLQINKRFFMKHCDDAIYSLIRLKAKPFPSQEDLLDRLDANMQWQEFKQRTLQGFLKQCRRLER